MGRGPVCGMMTRRTGCAGAGVGGSFGAGQRKLLRLGLWRLPVPVRLPPARVARQVAGPRRRQEAWPDEATRRGDRGGAWTRPRTAGARAGTPLPGWRLPGGRTCDDRWGAGSPRLAREAGRRCVRPGLAEARCGEGPGLRLAGLAAWMVGTGAGTGAGAGAGVAVTAGAGVEAAGRRRWRVRGRTRDDDRGRGNGSWRAGEGGATATAGRAEAAQLERSEGCCAFPGPACARGWRAWRRRAWRRARGRSVASCGGRLERGAWCRRGRP